MTIRASRGELTPQQHARIRRQLALIPVYLWLAYGWTDLLLHLPKGVPGSDGPVTRDFVQFYVPGTLANERNARALYDIDAWPAIVARLVPDGSSARYPPVYGPQISVFFSPLARLPYITAMLAWMAFTLLAYVTCGHLLWKASPRLHDRRWTITLLLLAAPALHYALTFAQISAIALLCEGALQAVEALVRDGQGLVVFCARSGGAEPKRDQQERQEGQYSYRTTCLHQ